MSQEEIAQRGRNDPDFKQSKLEREHADPWKQEGCNRIVIYTPEVLRSALHNAVGKANVADVQLCVARGASLEWRDEGDGCGMTVLHLVACCDAPMVDRLAVLDYLIAEGVQLDAIDYMESTALHAAAALGDTPIVTRLLKAGASPRAWDAESLTPLHLAANNGHLQTARALVAYWAPVDESDIEPHELDDPKLRTDKERDRVKSQGSKRLQRAGTNLYVARRGSSLHVCAAANRLSVARMLLEEAGADVDNGAGPQQSRPLHIAARCGLKDVCLLLLDNGADVNATDAYGETPLMRAVEGQSAGICRLLLKRGADPSRFNHHGLTALHIAAACGLADFFAPLVLAGAEVDAADTRTYKDWDGARTPLHYAAHYGKLAHFKTLIDLGADLRKMSKVGWSALFYAVENAKKKPGRKEDSNWHLQLVEWIVDQDLAGNVWCTASNGRTPLMLAAIQGAVECAELLCRKQPWSVNMRDGTGRTALHWAAVRSEGDTMEAILTFGAKPLVRDNEGKSPGDLYTDWIRPPTKRQWEEERQGAMGERRWDYSAVMENTKFRYMKKAMAARRVREIARERQCNTCRRFSFDAMRCGSCKVAYYCSSQCQKKDWHAGGHRLYCKATKSAPKEPANWNVLKELDRKPY